MGHTIFPTANDVTTSTGDGVVIKEQSLASWIGNLVGQNFIISGMTLPGSDADLVIPVAAGEAWIDNHHVTLHDALNATCTANQTNHIFLKLTKDGGGNVDGLQLEVNLTGTPPADSVYIGTAVAGASSISSTTDNRIRKPVIDHDHTSDGEEGGDVNFIINGEVLGSDFNSNSISVTTGTPLTSVIAMTTTALHRVFLSGRCYVRHSGNQASGAGLTVRLVRDTTTIDQVVLDPSTTDVCVSLQKIDNPGVDTPEYRLEILASDSQTINTDIQEIILSALQCRL